MVPGAWVRIGNRLHQIRTVSGDRTGGVPNGTTVTLIPDVPYTGRQELNRALTARIRHLESSPIPVPANRYHSGPVTFPWVERLDA